MHGKMARSAPRPPFGLLEVTVAVRTSRLSCRKAGTTRMFSPVQESSGESWPTSWVSHAAWPQIKMQEHKTARMAQEQQSSVSGALLGELQFSVSARPASGGCRFLLDEIRVQALGEAEQSKECRHATSLCSGVSGDLCRRIYSLLCTSWHCERIRSWPSLAGTGPAGALLRKPESGGPDPAGAKPDSGGPAPAGARLRKPDCGDPAPASRAGTHRHWSVVATRAGTRAPGHDRNRAMIAQDVGG
jgi:hypothetical protein